MLLISTETKVCIACKKPLPLDAFYAAKTMRDGLLGRCKRCHVDGQRSARYQRLYGISKADYDARLLEQGGACKICRSTSPGGKAENFAVDHDHRTGRVRGLLCLNCNVLLANAKDDSNILLAAIRYLGCF